MTRRPIALSHTFSFRQAIGRTPAVVWLVSAVWTVGLALWSVVPPPFVAADEPQHVDMVIDAADIAVTEWFGIHGDQMDGRLGVIQRQLGYFDEATIEDSSRQVERRTAGRLASQAPPREQRLGLSDQGGLAPPQAARTNQMTQHPPIYYRILGSALAVWPEWMTVRFDLVLAVLRLLTVAMVAPLPLLAAWTVRALGERPGVEAMAAAGVMVIPQTAHLGSVVTNDALLITLGGLVTMLAAQVLTGDTSRRTGVRLGLAVTAAMLTKALALVLPVAVVAAYVAARRTRGQTWRSVAAAAAICGAIIASAGWWYGENVVRFGSVQPAVLPPPTPEVRGGVLDFLATAAPIHLETFWGRFGWAEVGFNTGTAASCTLALVLFIAVGLWRRRAPLAVVLLGPSVLSVLIVWMQSYSHFAEPGQIRAVAGRYAAVGLVGLTVAASMGVGRLLDDRRGMLAVLLGAAALHSAALWLALPYFWTVRDGTEVTDLSTLADAGRSLLSWGGLPPGVVMGLVGLFVVLFGALLIEVARRPTITSGRQGEGKGQEQDDQHVSA